MYPRLQKLMSGEVDHLPLLSDPAQPPSSGALQPMGHAANQAAMATTPIREAHTPETRARQRHHAGDDLEFLRYHTPSNASLRQPPHATQQFPGSQAANGFYEQLLIVNSGMPGEDLRLRLQHERDARDNHRRAQGHLQPQEHLRYQQYSSFPEQHSGMEVKQENAQVPIQEAQNAVINNQVGKVIKQEAQALGDLESQHYVRKYVAVTREDYAYMAYYSGADLMAREGMAVPRPKQLRPAQKGDPDGEYIWSV
ncbi:hypothetical protein BDP81DRAFT_32490 [Colletotrichum phormii]|uniref:Uncharacterized protein n=1 Tax=Colletotrichum phormii TaxID=359342 RepID=A0AAI9ZPY7_9PEZI|nr:uncharacterized protein BDP81DRAFT_32490 [Colletotrichum phormii]KAK1636019.1 hypothetical protein BDP81DRAFT_32490 [Colletotrichum phormii]